jgi:hypothetical protein
MVSETPPLRRHLWLPFSVVFLLAAAYYSWAVRVGDTPFHWGFDLGGYHNQLGRAFALGQLHLEVEPKAELLALADPYDWRNDESLRMHDMVLYNKRYYLYHGAAPALFFFTPFRFLNGHDVSESFVLLLMALGTYVFYTLAFVTLKRELPLDQALWVALGLAFATGFPLLAKRVWVYEIAIGGAALFLSAGVFALARLFSAPRFPWVWAALAGLAFGVSVGCRPHLAFVGALVLLVVFFQRGWRTAAAYTVPFALCGLAIAGYNYARFGNPFEFGVQYLLTGGPNQRLHFGLDFLPLSLFFFLVCPPKVLPQSPWLAPDRPLLLGNWEIPYPQDMYSEPTTGVFILAPCLLASFLGLRQRDLLPRLLLAVALLTLLVVCTTGFVTQRYVVDFLPPWVFASILLLASQRQARLWLPLSLLPGILLCHYIKL